MRQLTLEDVIPLHLADVTFPETHPRHGQSGEIYAFVVRHPGGLILFETGIGRGKERLERAYQVVHRPLDAELERLGHSVDNVRAVVNSHLHFDHCGNNQMFAGTPIYVQAAELHASRQPKYTVPDWVEFVGAEYVEIDGDAHVANGVRILSTPGHTAGHQSLVIDTDRGRVALAGQAIYSKAEYDSIRRSGEAPTEDPPPDPERYVTSACRLIKLRPRRVLFSHDHAVWDDGS